MLRIIISHDEDIEPELALTFVANVILKGRISEAAGIQHYCWATRFAGFTVWVNRKRSEKSADSFRVMKDKGES